MSEGNLGKYPTDAWGGGSCKGNALVGEVTGPAAATGDVFVGSGRSSVDPWAQWPYGKTMTRTHRLWLRDDFEVEIKLPVDLTVAETTRLQGFLGLLHCQKPEPSKEEW